MCFSWVLKRFCFADEHLKNLTIQNICLLLRSMYPVVLREIAVEETALVQEMVQAVSLERAAYGEVIREFGPGYDAGLLNAEIEGYKCVVEDCKRHLSELSFLGQVVEEMRGLEGGVSFDGYTLEGLQSVLEEVKTDSRNVLTDWFGGVHVD